MNNIHHQAGEPSVTPHDRVESKDGMKVKLLLGTKEGQVGQVVVLNWQKAQREIAAGRAESKE
jgi:hypothetical protein